MKEQTSHHSAIIALVAAALFFLILAVFGRSQAAVPQTTECGRTGIAAAAQSALVSTGIELVVAAADGSRDASV